MTEKEGGGGRAGGFRRPEKACKMAIKMKIKPVTLSTKWLQERRRRKERDCNQHAPL